MGMITSPSSWEQVIYDVVAAEALDPWDVDLVKLADGFVAHIQKLETMDFSVPAKYLMVAATLLRMKSDHLPLLDYFNEDGAEGEVTAPIGSPVEAPSLNLLTIPPRRVPQRHVVVSDLVAALRKVLGSAQRKDVRLEQAKRNIKIKGDDIGRRISALYDRISAILGRVKGEETTFSKVVPEWSKKEVAGTFLPLVYLDHQKRVQCRQEEVFQEIYIRRPGGAAEKQPARKKPYKSAKRRER